MPGPTAQEYIMEAMKLKQIQGPVYCSHCFCQWGEGGEAVVDGHKVECHCSCHTRRPAPVWVACPDCDGQGFHEVDNAGAWLSHQMKTLPCPRCEGEGEVDLTCPDGREEDL